ncbi:MAG TPA: alpha/beta hydrolase [Pedomonas sp.]|uniref:alpha/beta hydrolase n=1 Tax=Pedomonas sp. TaxID=2976421 RepID=UPI002F419214
MTVDPQIAAMLANAPEFPTAGSIPVDVLRKAVRDSSTAIPGPNVPIAAVEDRTIPGPGGELPIRLYTPVGTGPFPIVVYFHGGGWVVGDLDTQDMIARGLCAGSESIVVSVDYRLAPENPFPAAIEDAWAATQWAYANAREIGGDPERMGVAGDSAGGSLAAVSAIFARDAGAPALRAQVLFYGACNYPSVETPSAKEYANGPILRREDTMYFWSQYLTDPEREQHDFRASPLRAESHAGLAPAFVGTAECDPSRDDAENYGQKLKDAGVEVDVQRYKGMIHGFVSWVGFLPGAQQAMADANTFLKRQFAK